MGVKVVGFEMAPSPVEIEQENGKLNQKPVRNESIRLGSHGDEPVELEAKTNVLEADILKNAVDEWPANKQIHTFYFVKYRPYEDSKLKAKLDFADKEIQKNYKARLLILERLKANRLDRALVISQLKSLTSEDKQFRDAIDMKRMEMEPIHQAPGNLRGTRGDKSGICSSEEELDALICSLRYRIEHENISLIEEKQILINIKQLEQMRERLIANDAIKTKIQESLGKNESIQDQLIGGGLDGVRKDQQILRSKIKQLEEELRIIDSYNKSLQQELADVCEERDKAVDNFQQLRKQREEGNAYYYQNRRLLNDARYLASKMDVKALEELSHTEVEKFMSLWNNKAFRDEYEKRILGSLDYRQLSRDGRIRNPDEKPLVVFEKSWMVSDAVPKVNVQKPKEDTKPLRLVESKEMILLEDKENISETRKILFTKSKVDEMKLNEMKLQEEKEKAKLALERKKKLADKFAAKAAVNTQKEAEKKLKDQEKKAKKKAAASTPAPDSDESIEGVSEVEPEATETTLEALSPTTNKVQRENTIRSRNCSKGQDSLSKAILEKNKSTNYWSWVVPMAILFLYLLRFVHLFFPSN